ncbi:MAG: hypothetical protein KAQ81_00185, partial [Deltaproteobacteria bacterium]|nr:hypothetical protein [Deltaproteobacteria bacterium]
LKISTPYLMCFQTFRAAFASKLVFRNSQMTMPAPELIAFNRYKCEDLVFACGHKDITVRQSGTLVLGQLDITRFKIHDV